MAENLEIRIEQLTEVVKNLYSRPALSQSEINNLMTSLAQKFENSNDANIQKLLNIIVNETKKTLEDKHHEISQQLWNFENLVKQSAKDSQNYQISNDVGKILNEVSSMFQKLSNQEIAIQKLSSSFNSNKTTNFANEIIKLSTDFTNFSRGFENITNTLNKNFADFLNQIKAYNTKEEVSNIQDELDTINGNVNSIISALAIIDHKYQDLTGLVDAFSQKESAFKESIGEIKNLKDTFNRFNQEISKTSTKDEINEIAEKIYSLSEQAKGAKEDINQNSNQNTQKTLDAISNVEEKVNQNAKIENINNLKNELRESTARLSEQNEANKKELISKIQENMTQLKTLIDDSIKDEVFEHTNGLSEGINYINTQVNKLSETIGADFSDKSQKVNQNIEALKNQLEQIKSDISTLPKNETLSQIKNIENSINAITKQSFQDAINLINAKFSDVDRIISEKDFNTAQSLNNAVEGLKSEIKNSSQNLYTYKNEISTTLNDNLSRLQEPIQKTLQELEEAKFEEKLNEIKENINGTNQELLTSFEQIKKELQDICQSTGAEAIVSFKEFIPEISERLDEFKNNLVIENIKSFEELKESFIEITDTINESLLNTTVKVQEELKTSYQESLGEIKLDLQTLSNHLIESVENVNSNISGEFENYSNALEEFLNRIDNYENSFANKVSSIEASIASASENSFNKISDTIRQNGINLQESISSTKTDLSECINKTKAEILEGISNNTKNSKSDFAIIEEKINKVLATQIKNDSENTENAIFEVVSSILEKIEHASQQQIHNAKELLEEIQNNDNEISLKVDALGEKLDSVSIAQQEVPQDKKEPQDVNEYLTKIDEYLANVEYLKNNLSEDLKECIQNQIGDLEDKFENVLSDASDNIEKINTNIAKIASPNEETNYTYSMQDIESDIAKLRLIIEKNFRGENYKEFINRLIEIKNINIENNRINRSLEGQMVRLNTWLKGATQKLGVLAQQVENAERMSVEEIKTRLVHSEKTATAPIRDDGTGRKQLAYLHELNEKLNALMQKQNGEFDPANFIDVAYENMKQTKNIAKRMDNLEDKIDRIQNYMEKIVAYIDE